VKAYVDTNVLVAASIQEHQHHVQGFRFGQGGEEGTLARDASALTVWLSLTPSSPVLRLRHASTPRRPAVS